VAVPSAPRRSASRRAAQAGEEDVEGVGGAAAEIGVLVADEPGGGGGRERGTALDISALRPNNQALTGYFLGAELFFGDRAHQAIGRHLADIAAGDLRVIIDRSFPLSQAAAAYLESRQAFGRVLLVP
jgi:NADPH2:quinone reductase